jgi:hypothetical protein
MGNSNFFLCQLALNNNCSAENCDEHRLFDKVMVTLLKRDHRNSAGVGVISFGKLGLSYPTLRGFVTHD